MASKDQTDQADQADNGYVVLADAVVVTGKDGKGARRYEMRERIDPADVAEHSIGALVELGAIAPAGQKGLKRLTAKAAAEAAGSEPDSVSLPDTDADDEITEGGAE